MNIIIQSMRDTAQKIRLRSGRKNPERNRMYYIGIDLGTSAVKLLLMDGEGAVQKIVSREYPVEYPAPGWSQQNPEDWRRESFAGIRELTDGLSPEDVRGISFGGQMHGLVALDKTDRVIRPAILWNDGRCKEETDYLNETIGRERLFSLTGNIAFAGFTAPKLLWMKKHEPELFSRIRKIMLPQDYLAWCLTGVHSTDYSDASGTLLLDVKRRVWSEEMLDICGLSMEQMPRLFESFEPVGRIKPELAARLGVAADCVVAAGAGDNAAAAVGTGTVGEGGCNISVGTSGTVFISGRSFRADNNYALHAFAHADGCYHLMGCMLSAASCNKWWMDGILGTGDYQREQEAVGALGENPVFFLPYLMGERSPHNNPDARGVFIGLSMDTDRARMTQAVLEGVAFAIRDSFEVAKSLGLCPEQASICGGGARSALWKRIFANVLNKRIVELETEEGPSLGAAMLAAVADGAFPCVEAAAGRIVKTVRTIEPEPALAAKYEARYQKFRKLYPALEKVFGEIVQQLK